MSERCTSEIRTYGQHRLCSLDKGHDGQCQYQSVVFQSPERPFTQRDLDLAVLEARVKAFRQCAIYYRETYGQTISADDMFLEWAESDEVDLQKKKAELEKKG